MRNRTLVDPSRKRAERHQLMEDVDLGLDDPGGRQDRFELSNKDRAAGQQCCQNRRNVRVKPLPWLSVRGRYGIDWQRDVLVACQSWSRWVEWVCRRRNVAAVKVANGSAA